MYDELGINTPDLSSVALRPAEPAGGSIEPGRPVAVTTPVRARRALTDAVAHLLDGRERLWVLEAGAGPQTLFDLPEDAYIVGVAANAEVLAGNERLDERVVNDLADYRPWASGFDLITCWYGLDDMADPATMIERLAGWSARDGLIVLAATNVRSPRGLLSRLTGELRPRWALTAPALRRRLGQHGFAPVFEVFFEDAVQATARRRLRITYRRWKAVQAAVRLLSLGLLDAARTDYLAVFRRDGECFYS
jgi:methyltransferase family protein